MLQMRKLQLNSLARICFYSVKLSQKSEIIHSMFSEKMRFFLCLGLQGRSPNATYTINNIRAVSYFSYTRPQSPTLLNTCMHFLGSLLVGLDLGSQGPVYRDSTVVETDAQAQLPLRSKPKLFQVLLTLAYLSVLSEHVQ